MKRWTKVTSAVSMLVMFVSLVSPVQALAEQTTTNSRLTSLDFASIEKEVSARNPVVSVNKDLVDSTSYGKLTLSNTISDMNNAIDELDNGIDNFKDAETALKSSPYYSATISQGTLPNPTGYTDLSGSVGTDGGLGTNDKVLLGGVSANLSSIVGLYDSNIASLEGNKKSLQKQLDQLQSQHASLEGTLEQVKLQTEMGNKLLVWAAQSLYAAYNKLTAQQQDLTAGMDLLLKQLAATKLRVELGFALDSDLALVQNKINDLHLASDTLTMQTLFLKGDLNILLGQDYDSPLEIQTMPDADLAKISTASFNRDVDGATDLSYSIRTETALRDAKKNVANLYLNDSDYGDKSNQYLQAKADQDAEEVKVEDDTRKFQNDFHKAYVDLQIKQETYNVEQDKLKTETTNFNQAKLKHDLGLISDLELAGATNSLYSEQNKVQSLANDLEMSYVKYQWMKTGVSFDQSNSAKNS